MKMKKLIVLPALMLAMVACQNGNQGHENDGMDSASAEAAAPAAQIAYFGAEINEEGALSASEAMAQLGEMDSVNLKLTGTIDKVCQVKGCWMTMATGENGESMHVSFRDYGFFVPKDIDGKEAIIDGTLYMETTSVEDLRHYAEDEGKSEEEIAMITEPETRMTFVADGVIVKDYEVTINAADGSDEEAEMEEEHDHSDHDHGDHEH